MMRPIEDRVNIEVRWLQRGQPRPYAPHTWEAEIEIHSKYPPLEEQLKDLVRALIHYFTEEPDVDMASHFQPRLRKLDKIRDDEPMVKGAPREVVWHVLI